MAQGELGVTLAQALMCHHPKPVDPGVLGCRIVFTCEQTIQPFNTPLLSAPLQDSCTMNKWIEILEDVQHSSVVALLLLPDVWPLMSVFVLTTALLKVLRELSALKVAVP